VTPAPPTPVRRRRRLPRAAPLGVTALLAGLALGLVALRDGARERTEQAALGPPSGLLRVTGAPSVFGPAAPRPAAAVAPRPAAAARRPRRRPGRPVHVAIPAIGVHAAIVPLGLNRDRTLQTPTNVAQAGWWSGGPRPGARGAAVVVGHVDSTSGPGVFYALRALRRGDAIAVTGADGRVQRFVVQHLARYAKDRFPTAAVYGPFHRPRLRLITCGGAFDTATGHYRDNTVVFARPA